MQYLRTERAELDELSRYPGNARIHDAGALDESVRENGQYRSVVARELDDGKLQILAGHGTVDALQRKGTTHARVEVIRASDVEARRIVLADNGSSRKASYDDALLLDLLDSAARDGGLVGTGWDQESFDVLTAALLDRSGHEPVTPPEDFPSYDENIDTQYTCPRCQYSWSGKTGA